MRNGSVRIITEEGHDSEESKSIERIKTPMPRARKTKMNAEVEELDETGIVDRDEDLYNDNDDVSTSTLHGSDESLAEYIKEENKINAEKSNGNLKNGKMRKLRNSVEKVVANFKDNGFSCRNVDNVITEHEPNPQETVVNGRDTIKSCSIM